MSYSNQHSHRPRSSSRRPILIDSDEEDNMDRSQQPGSRNRPASTHRSSTNNDPRIHPKYPIVRHNYHTTENILKDLPDEQLPPDADQHTILTDDLDHLTCAICSTLMINARIWPCHHTFCRLCTRSTFDMKLSSMIQENGARSPIDGPIEVDCPMCRQATKSFEPEPFEPIKKAIKCYLNTNKKVI